MSDWVIVFLQSLGWMFPAALIGLFVGFWAERSKALGRVNPSPATDESLDGVDLASEASTAPPGAEPSEEKVIEPVIPDRYAEDTATALAAANARIEALTEELNARSSKDAVEYGRLEAAALRSLDEIIEADQARIKQLTTSLEEIKKKSRTQERKLQVGEQRIGSLKNAIAERDSRILELDAELVKLRREK
ncbi:hypothetical protein [Dermatophilus congolensis]|uniref:Uncharacterized protein n=1 Tax=Dermatophilus congolensis TaxID=1863 RepID=A0AA46BMH0_9MICO|nr:hypothetical protein [Dermatophilus congolensis]MBO3142580.1 hypothetical protein [Dermatophilus congolensis]MBO3151568.1 hypothetical protein [Dermatophilus congolensis]MBO3161429.1 hypothetical protein [Dermatophilus congolensis]MBO3162853.1 hypothetical protein [Dermatophilus congolensis]MBO3176407.1 hypothetical protein [Dermatophilus congolensis]